MPPRPPRPLALPGWTPILVGGALGVAGLIGALALQQSWTARRAWPTVRATVQHLATDEGASALWRRNPGLRRDFPDEQAFLAEARAWRDRVGTLPEREPAPGPAWQRVAGPWTFEARAQGSGGGWIQVTRMGTTPFHAVEGDGLSFLAFGGDPTDLARAREARSLRCADVDWQRLRGVAHRLATPEGTKALWLSERSLHRTFPSPESLEARAARLRPHLTSLPATAHEAGPRLDIHRSSGPYLEHTDVAWVDKGQPILQTEWEDGTLTRLDVP